MQNQAFNLKPSRQYRLLLGLLCVLAFVAIMALPISIFIKFGLFLAVFLYGRYLARPIDIIRLNYLSDQSWLLVDHKGKAIPADLLGDSTVTTCVSVLRFKVAHRRFSQNCLVFRDSLAKGQYRALRVVLRS